MASWSNDRQNSTTMVLFIEPSYPNGELVERSSNVARCDIRIEPRYPNGELVELSLIVQRVHDLRCKNTTQKN